MYWYWWAWFGFVALLILIPLSYGWGYRQMGPPYPRYYYRRRQANQRAGRLPADDRPAGEWTTPAEGRTLVTERPVETGTAGRTWGIIGDLIWLAAFGAVIWAIVALWA